MANSRFSLLDTPALLFALGVLGLLFGIEFFAILSLNEGSFTYTLDDPYIHLALAENLLHGHYGVNVGETSAASSSIIWPVILAPFSGWFFSALLLNALFAAATVYVLYRFMQQFMSNEVSYYVQTAILCVFIFASNLLGLSFMGMEHTLQVLAVVLIALGLVQMIERGTMPACLPIIIIVAPLVRYENLAISAAALCFLLLQKQYKVSLISGAVLFAALIAFSLLLISLGLGYMPSSVMAKNAVVQMNMQANTFLLHLTTNLTYRSGWVLLITDILLVIYALLPKGLAAKRQLAICTALAITLHLFIGRTGWYNRYEIYIGTFTLMVVLYLAWSYTYNNIQRKRWLYVVPAVPALLGVLYMSVPYVKDLFTLPLAANNVYEQHYQMHRFAADFYNKPVAVNDLGLVAYQNPNYVLDLWGLGSLEALNGRLRNDNYLEEMPARYQVGLAMVYEAWFPNIPASWQKVAQMSLSRQRITPAEGVVSFYVIDAQAREEILGALRDFANSLPEGLLFTILE